MSKMVIAVEGFIANEPTMVATLNGHRVVNVTVPHTPRKRDDETGEWVDAGPTVWAMAAFWDEHADAVIGSVRKGTLITLTGTGVQPRAWEANGKSGINLTVTNPTLATIIQCPKRTPEATGNPGWATTPTPEHAPQQPTPDPWGDVPPADDIPF